MDITHFKARAFAVRERYAAHEIERHGKPWGIEELTLGFVRDVGELAKLIIARVGMRDIPDIDEKLAHELADCLWSILVIAQETGVNIEEAFMRTMDDLEARLS